MCLFPVKELTLTVLQNAESHQDRRVTNNKQLSINQKLKCRDINDWPVQKTYLVHAIVTYMYRPLKWCDFVHGQTSCKQ